MRLNNMYHVHATASCRCNPLPGGTALPVQGTARDLTTSRLRQIQWPHLAWPSSFIAPSSPSASQMPLPGQICPSPFLSSRTAPILLPRNSGLFLFPPPSPETDVSCSARSRLKACAAFCPGHCLLSTRVKPGRKGRLFSAHHPRSSRNICILPSGLPADLPQSWLALMPDYDPRHSSLSLPPSLVVVLARGQGGEWEMSSLRWLLCSIR
ncbi:uncharacterized protein IWZ02DRAFT_305473 [Phyllosticta citriasiana]|uniref:Uncharacterized protein n=1 Tax=Phyllosticta citriasiana TaxID=595635 RepID=A0ABR1KNI2_9PEZI